MTGKFGRSNPTRRCNSMPSIPGIRTSVTRQIASARAPDFRNSSADANTRAAYPADSTRLSMDSRTRKSSSTPTTILSAASGIVRVSLYSRLDDTAMVEGCLLYVYLGSARSARDPELVGHPHQFCQRPRAHLVHDLAPMNADRDLANAEVGGGF